MKRQIKRIIGYINFLIAWRFNGLSQSFMPLEISVETTNICNFKCSFCPQSTRTHFDKVGRHTLSIENAILIFTKLREFGYHDKGIHWTLDGDPFVNSNFAQIIRSAADFGFSNQHFATNCMLFTKEKAENLPKNVRLTLTVDFCADREYFEQYRGTLGSWEIIKRNISSILSEESLNQIHFSITDISTYRINDQTVLKSNFLKLKDLFPKSKRIKYYSKTFNNSTGFIEKEIIRKRYHLCPYPWSSLIIASNGDVVACCRDLEHKSILGNVLEEGGNLKKIWRGEKYEEFRANLRKKMPENNAACQKCDLPYDEKKYSLRNLIKTLINRLQIFK